MLKNNTKTLLPLLFGITLSVGMIIGYAIKNNIPDKSFFSFEKKNTLNEVLQLIQNNYVDKIDINKIADTAILAVLEQLDPHSSFIPASELESVNEKIRGDFYGIGIEYEMINDTLTVVNLLNEIPGEKSPIKKGDQLITVNTINIAGKKLPEDSIGKIIKAADNKNLQLTILRANKMIHSIIQKKIMSLSNITSSYMLNSNTGYIKLDGFSNHAYTDFMQALMALKKEHAISLVLDLRGNGGGVLDEAVEIADEFLDGDKLITYTEGIHSPKKEYRCRRLGQFEKGKLIVLSDEMSASASEILMGALQDWGRATIIGKTSFGKGLVQEQFDLSDHSALRLTIARYYTPFGRCIQRSYANGEAAYYEEAFHPSNIHKDNSTKHSNRKTFTSATGKKLYDQRGITPDIILSSDEDSIYEKSATFNENNLINSFAYHYYTTNINKLNQYQSVKSYNDSFQISEKDWINFKSYIPSEKMPLLNNQTIQELKKTIKLQVAKFHYDKKLFYQFVNLTDKVILQSLETIKE